MGGACAVQKKVLADVLQKRCQSCNFFKNRLQHKCSPMKFTKSLWKVFLQDTSTRVAAFGSKQCKPMKTYTTVLSCPKKWYTWTVLLRLVFLDKEYYLSFSKQCLAVPHFSKAVAKELKAEAVVRRCSVRKGFLEIPQNSQENTRVRVSHLQL